MEIIEREEAQRQALKKMRRIATGLLLGMTAVFIGAKLGEHSYSWLSFVRAFAEAAMVGALADWFAVSALFRHPLGLPIPHTAIIPKNKDRIGESLGNFVQNNFLSPDVIAKKLESLDIAQKAGEWLANPENSAMLSEKATSAIPAVLNAMNDADVQHFIEENISARLRAIEVAPIAGNILSLLTANNKHQELLNEALRFSAQLLEENKTLIREKIREESPWFVPGFVDNKVYDTIITKAEDTLREVNADPNHQLRRKFHVATQDFIQKLKTSDEYRDKGEQIKEEILSHPIIRQYFERVWLDLKKMILDDVEKPESGIRLQLEKSIRNFGTALLNDDAMREKINTYLREQAVKILAERRNEIGALIAETVRKWDGETMSQKIELQVGRDLQFIRINGTVVGGIVGLLIYAISLAF